ncbi:MAG TPA: cation:proton antiporter [Candidatus Binataceae bacterium]|jgi:Kef-type K+ transport system membrane component KefB|nr:cation:proton antiporter [Candidatus Binataceae bacterium]
MVEPVLRAFLIAVAGGPISVSAAAIGTSFDFGFAPLGGTAVLHELLALAVAIVMVQALGLAFRHLRQPLIVGEMIAGIVLGPSLLGWLSPHAFAFLFPPQAVAFLSEIARVGVILYMFLVGLELEPALLRRQTAATAAIAEFGILVPFSFGVLLAMPLFTRYSSSPGPFYFRFFMGLAMAVTAFPVLARILTDRRIHKTPVGAMALSSAALGDLTIWCLLALLLALLQARAAGAMATAAMIAGFAAVLVFVGRPLMVRLSVVYGNRARLTQGVMATIFVSLLVCALAAQMVGLGAFLGAFALGAVMPHDSGMTRELTDRLEDLVVVLVLPAFFAMIGLRTEVNLFGAGQWLVCGAIIVLASAAKIGASALAARMGGCGWRDASAVGVLMNTRGLVELIVLDIGFGLKIVSPEMFTMLVLMTVAATFATTPIIDSLFPRAMEEEDREPAGTISPALGPVRRAAIVVAISNPEGAANLLDLALEANRPGDPPPHVVALARRPAEGVRSGLREVEQRVAPQPPALAAALDHVYARSTAVTSQAVWTDDPALDILRAAKEAQSEWLLLGAHHSVFGSDLRGGVVRSIAERAETIPVNVAVLTPGPAEPLDRIFAVVDHSLHGRAALELGIRLVKRTKRSLHVILVPRTNVKPDLPLLEMVRSIGRAEGLRLHTDVLAERSAVQLARQAPGPLIIVGTNLLDEFDLPSTGMLRGSHSMIVVQGADSHRFGLAEHDRGAAGGSKS